MIKDRDIIVISIQHMDHDLWGTPQEIASEFAKNNRVLYVNTPIYRSTLLTQRNNKIVKKRMKVLLGKEAPLQEFRKNFWSLNPRMVLESINWINSRRIFDFFNLYNEKKVAKRIKKAIKELGFKNIILFNDNSMIMGQHFKELLKPDKYVYLLRDNIIIVPFWKKHGERLEPQLLKKVDVVCTNSEYYAKYTRKFNKNTKVVGQGVDIEAFNDDKGEMLVPDYITEIKKPRIGYLGAITTMRLSIDILVHIAKSRPDWNLVLVGPENEDFKKSELHKLDNVHFLGYKPKSEAPSIIKGFDVALNPQVINEITIGNYPLKTDEYLALGRANVATRTEFMEDIFSEYTYLADTKEEYVELIQKAIDEDSPEKVQDRMKFAKSHSWANMVEKIYDEIENC